MNDELELDLEKLKRYAETARAVPPRARDLEPYIQHEFMAIARKHARALTDDLRARGLLGEDEEIHWEWEDVSPETTNAPPDLEDPEERR